MPTISEHQRWIAWEGQRVASMHTDDQGITWIVLEDGRGATFNTEGHFFTTKPKAPELVQP